MKYLYYDDFLIKVNPDYAKMIKNNKKIDELWCEVYDEKDTEFKHNLGCFNMMQCFEYQEETVESIEKGIKEIVDSNWSSYELERKRTEFERTNELFHRAIHFLKVTLGEEGLGELLQRELGMTEEETETVLEPPDEEQTEDMELC